MTDKIASMRQFFVVEKGQKQHWQPETDPYFLAEEFARQDLSAWFLSCPAMFVCQGSPLSPSSKSAGEKRAVPLPFS